MTNEQTQVETAARRRKSTYLVEGVHKHVAHLVFALLHARRLQGLIVFKGIKEPLRIPRTVVLDVERALGVLDGWAGFVIAFGNAEGAFYKHAKAWCERRSTPPPTSPPLHREPDRSDP